MGKIILCTGKDAAHPFDFQSVGVSVSNMEELCYVLYHNAFLLKNELFSPELLRFIKEELGLAERAAYIKKLVDSHAGAKDIIVAIFCSADYYEEGEIKHFLREYDAFSQLNPIEQKKKEADRLLQCGKEKEAESLYKEIIASGKAGNLPEKEYGNLLHNLAVMEMKSGMARYAPERFREAYERNKEEESLKQYLLALKLTGQEELLEAEIKNFMPERALVDGALQELYLAGSSAEQSREFMELERAKELYRLGKTEEYHQCADALVKRLKSNYPRE